MKLLKTIKNLNRLDSRNLLRFFIYKLKKKIGKTLSKKEVNLYYFYSCLVNHNGYLIKENLRDYVINFKNLSPNLIKLRKRPSSDFDVFYQIFDSNEYLPVVNSYLDNFENSKNYTLNIIDAGSNIGLTSLFFINYFKKVAIVAVEPNNDNFSILSYNLKQRENYKFVKINGAVWSSNTKIKVVNDFRDKSDWSFRVIESDDKNSMKAYTINNLVEINNFKFIDILKIDIEGSEKQIFTTENVNLGFLNKTRCIAMEIHDEFDCRHAIYKVLNEYGFTLQNSGELTIGINKKLIL